MFFLPPFLDFLSFPLASSPFIFSFLTMDLFVSKMNWHYLSIQLRNEILSIPMKPRDCILSPTCHHYAGLCSNCSLLVTYTSLQTYSALSLGLMLGEPLYSFLLKTTYLTFIYADLQIYLLFVLMELEHSASGLCCVFLLMGICIFFSFVLLKLYDPNRTYAKSFSKILTSHCVKWLLHRTYVPTTILAYVKFFSRSWFTSWFLSTVLQSREQVFLEEIFDYRTSTKNTQETCCDARK